MPKFKKEFQSHFAKNEIEPNLTLPIMRLSPISLCHK